MIKKNSNDGSKKSKYRLIDLEGNTENIQEFFNEYKRLKNKYIKLKSSFASRDGEYLGLESKYSFLQASFEQQKERLM